jgi:hypothetical protein
LPVLGSVGVVVFADGVFICVGGKELIAVTVDIELVELTLIDVANVEFEPNPTEIELSSDTTCETKVLGVGWLDSALIEDMNGLVLTVELTLLEVEVSVKPEWATIVKGVLIE